MTDESPQEKQRCGRCGDLHDRDELSGVFRNGGCEQWCPTCWDEAVYGRDNSPSITPNLVMVASVLFIALVGMMVIGAAADDLGPYAEGASAWCDQQDGELTNSRVIGEHGGLHCELPNGTLVHMDEVPREQLEAACERGSEDD